MNFAIFTHVIHEKFEGSFYAYSPYVREMNLWLKYVEKVEIIAPKAKLKTSDVSSLGEAYIHPNLKFTEVSSFNLLNLKAFLKSIVQIPGIFYKILGVMYRADHLHIRCPGNIGLLAVIAQIFFPGKPKTVKYAGNWNPETKQPWTYRLQKWILSNTFFSRNVKVLVYGEWKNQSGNIMPFFTASFSEVEREYFIKDFKPPYQFIYTGNLVPGKGLKKTIILIDSLRKLGLDCKLQIYGDGVLEENLIQMVKKLELEKNVEFIGRVNLQNLKQAYRKAHFSILLSKSEGWPKALAEAMFFGCVPIGSAVSCVPWMLGFGTRGVVLENGLQVATEEISGFLKETSELAIKSKNAQAWSQLYTVEKFEDEIKKLL